MSANSLRDSYGRAIGDLRVSVTDRCNFRCTYCIPVQNIEWKRREEIQPEFAQRAQTMSCIGG